MIDSYLIFLAPVMGAVAIFIGVLACISPSFMSKAFGIQASDAAEGYVIALGMRDIYIGVTILTLYSFSLFQLLGYLTLGIGVVAITDFLTVFFYGNKKVSVTHLGGAIFAFPYGAFLMSL